MCTALSDNKVNQNRQNQAADLDSTLAKAKNAHCLGTNITCNLFSPIKSCVLQYKPEMYSKRFKSL